ncbi:hypothetical protein D3C78_1535220 [compost metagenome]
MSTKQQLEENGIVIAMLEAELIAAKETIQSQLTPRLIGDWHEDFGDVLWWSFPIQEPPYCGSPLADDWPDYHTHWTPIITPEEPV